MTGFNNPNRVETKTVTEPNPVFTIAELSGAEMELYVRRGRRLRAAHLALWGQQMIQTWKSLFRRPGQLVAQPSR